MSKNESNSGIEIIAFLIIIALAILLFLYGIAKLITPIIMKIDDVTISFLFLLGCSIFILYIFISRWHYSDENKEKYIEQRKALVGINAHCFSLNIESNGSDCVISSYRALLRAIFAIERSFFENSSHFKVMHYLNKEFEEGVRMKDDKTIQCAGNKISLHVGSLIQDLNKEMKINEL